MENQICWSFLVVTEWAADKKHISVGHGGKCHRCSGCIAPWSLLPAGGTEAGHDVANSPPGLAFWCGMLHTTTLKVRQHRRQGLVGWHYTSLANAKRRCCWWLVELQVGELLMNLLSLQPDVVDCCCLRLVPCSSVPREGHLDLLRLDLERSCQCPVSHRWDLQMPGKLASQTVLLAGRNPLGANTYPPW